MANLTETQSELALFLLSNAFQVLAENNVPREEYDWLGIAAEEAGLLGTRTADRGNLLVMPIRKQPSRGRRR